MGWKRAAVILIRFIPRGTHYWPLFIRPADLRLLLEKSGFSSVDFAGIRSARKGREKGKLPIAVSPTGSTRIIYFGAARKPVQHHETRLLLVRAGLEIGQWHGPPLRQVVGAPGDQARVHVLSVNVVGPVLVPLSWMVRLAVDRSGATIEYVVPPDVAVALSAQL
jgi:hypothetical protein